MQHRTLAFHLAITVLATVVPCASICAQRTWIVDPENRAGTDFTNLPPAIAASSTGDTISIRASATAPISISANTNKGLTIIGERSHLFSGGLTIHSLPAGQRFVMRGLAAPWFVSAWLEMNATISVQACAGTVHLQDIACQPAPQLSNLLTTLRITVSNSPHVTLRGCVTTANPEGLAVSGSTVLAVDSFFGGFLKRYGEQVPRATYPAASLLASEVLAVDSLFMGGSGFTIPYLCTPFVPNRHGVAMSASRLVLIGSRVFGGAYTDWSCLNLLRPEPSVIGNGTISADAASSLSPPPLVSVTTGAHPITRSSVAASGGNVDLTVTAPPAAVAATFASLPGPVAATPFGTLWLDPGLLALVDLATIDPTGRRSFQLSAITVPNGVPLSFQTALLIAGTVSLTVPSVTVLAP